MASLYESVVAFTPEILRGNVIAFLDQIMPSVIAYVVFIWAIVGFYYLFKYIFIVLQASYARILRPSKNLKRCYGSWAIITGCTDGIGEAMAFELAKKGLNLLLLSRSKEKLGAMMEILGKKFPGVDVKTIDIDFGAFDTANRTRVVQAIKDMDVGVLINNVGMSYPYTKYFHELDEKRVDDIISINVTSTSIMTHLVLPGMVDRKRGAIVNVASAAGVAVSPLLAQYGAAKSYITMFSKALNVEMRDFNIHVQVQVPLFVATKLAKISKTSLFVPSPAAYARAAVGCIGYEAEVSPYWSHALQLWVMSFIPEWKIEAWIIKHMHYSIRKAGMKKDARKAAAEELASSSSTSCCESVGGPSVAGKKIA